MNELLKLILAALKIKEVRYYRHPKVTNGKKNFSITLFILYLNMYNPIQIANYFINKSFETGNLLTPMKVLKLVYLAHGWHLAVRDKPLITEVAEAWKYGPVIPSVYHAYKKFGNKMITSMVKYSISIIQESSARLLDKVFDVYKFHNGIQLSDMCNSKGSPWDITRNRNWCNCCENPPIPNNIIKEHYQKLVANNKEKKAVNI